METLTPRFADVDHCLNTGVIEASTDSDTTWSTIRTWLADCTEHHTACSSARPAGPLPTRVIEITPGQPLKLVLASELVSSSPADYATLSHCWGSHMPLRLLTSNLSYLLREIPLEKLSKTFQHAVAIARRMEVTYLWIDSLCIIQDSASDWLAESATMASVYSNARFNISAAHAPDGNGGCFATRDPAAALAPLHVHVPWAGWGTSPGSRAVLERHWWRRHVDAAPLLQRAWVFQEQVLARRNLIFGDVEVLFVCRETVASEQFPSGIPERLWDALVEEFSGRNLTRGTDKLIAFSAVASQMRRHIRSDYLAGLWRVYLPGQLLWWINSMHAELQPRPECDYIAPSWSWAS
ncbi:HET-domain-containing protein, partial [Trichoderma citrinoviride]